MLPAGNHVLASPFDARPEFNLAEVTQHHTCAEQERRRIGLSLTGDIRCGAVNAFKDGRALADVAAGRNPQTADQTRTKIADDVAVDSARSHQNVEDWSRVVAQLSTMTLSWSCGHFGDLRG
jgi:hypothetical protein